MPFLQQTLPDGSPNPSAVFVDALLTAGLYHQDPTPFRVYGAISGSTLVGFSANPNTFNPDYGILHAGDTVLVAFAGTTNSAQWAGHCLSAVIPEIDLTTGTSVFGSFLVGLGYVEQEINNIVNTMAPSNLIVTGHSYGAGASMIWVAHQRTHNPSLVVDLTTFGEPSSYGSLAEIYQSRTHNRIVGAEYVSGQGGNPILNRDPVSLTSPGSLQLAGFGRVVRLGKLLGAINWRQYGRLYFCNTTQLWPAESGQYEYNLPVLDVLQLVGQLGNADLHSMDGSYLPKAMAAWQRSGANPELTALVPIANVYIGTPTIPANNLGPALSSETINTAWGQPAGTVTDSERLEFAAVSVTAAPNRFSPGLASSMAITPSYKGTYFFSQDGQGSSESYYAATGPAYASYGGMMNAMLALAPYRLALSQCSDNPQCTNPLVLLAIRVENEQVARDSLLNTFPGIVGQSFQPPAPSPASLGSYVLSDNDDDDAAYKISFTDGAGHSSVQYLHGVPLASQVNVALATNYQATSGIGDRTPKSLNPQWLNKLMQFGQQITTLGLGLRYSQVQWTPNGTNVPVVGTGNGTPLQVVYNLAGTANNTYSLQFPGSNTFPATKVRWICRAFKSLRVLNGRWPANVFPCAPPLAGFWVNILHRAAQYDWDGSGYVSPEVWSVFSPSPSINNTSGLPGVSGPILTSKKTGKPFDLQRGRRSNRAT